MNGQDKNTEAAYKQVIGRLINVIIVLLAIIVVLFVVLCLRRSVALPAPGRESPLPAQVNVARQAGSEMSWTAPDTCLIAGEANADEVRYGRELIVGTSKYFGALGSLRAGGNALNCGNCHLEAGTKIYGNNFSAVASTYPKFRARSGQVETIHKRVNDCFERSLNSKAIDTASREMLAIVAYIKWLGKGVEKGIRPEGAGLKELAYLDRAADTAKGGSLFKVHCTKCHGENGEGRLGGKNGMYEYPPLWGPNSYNTAAGLYRLSRLAAFIKCNMPQGTAFNKPSLSDENAWDIAAFVNSRPRPDGDQSKDWPDRKTKPVDYPYGPFTDGFTEQQHKYGPFGPIAEARKQ